VPGRKRPHLTAPATDLLPRVLRALNEGRSQQALELSKVLFRREPTPEHRELLRRAYLDRGRDLRERGAGRDSVIVLKAALESQGNDPAWLTQLAEQLAQSGALQEVFALLPRLADPAVQDRLLGHVVDTALRQGPAGRVLLPGTYQADFDRVVQAFALSESGQDEGSREALAGIGLRSPFLEWKLLIRGLLAYYAGDDVRATENWQRLSTERLPARLASPFRQMIDAPFRSAQPAATQVLLQQQFNRLQASPLAARLRELRSAVVDKDNLAPAFRLAEALLPDLRRTAPALVERLARVFYWSITETGPDDVPRYQRVFGRPLTDPQFHRLHALAYERGGELTGAHKYWQKYEQEIAANPAHWPEGQSKRARALIWTHMGHSAARLPSAGKLPLLPRYLPDMPDFLRPLKPEADVCFQHATELAPDLLEPYEALFDYHRDAERGGKAEAAARRLLKHFPDHVPTLEALGDLRHHKDDQVGALAQYERALRANPFDRLLRAKAVSAQLGCARLLAVAERFDDARKELEAALALRGGTPDSVYLCRSAAVELKAGDTVRADELLEQARQQTGSELVVSYRMLTEVIRLELARPNKTRFERAFTAALAEPPSGNAAAGLAGLTAALDAVATYPGQKTHRKKVLAYLTRAKKADFTELQLQEVCSSLLSLDAIRLARQLLNRGRIEFPNNPDFPYLEAQTYFLQKKPEDIPVWKVQPLLEKAERLARALPATDFLKTMLDDISKRLHALAALNPLMGGMMSDFFGTRFDDDDDDDDDIFGDDDED
jgi:tetratricopeptide (TPR) repeat protein